MSMSRRRFLKKSLGAPLLVTAAGSLPPLLARAAAAAQSAPARDDTVLIVLQMSGGNDGLNTVVPYTDELYAKARPTLRLPADKVHKIDDQFGFHPQMPAFLHLYKQGVLTVLHGVGYPNPNQDHVAAMRVWQTGNPNHTESQTGWLGRAIDGLSEADRAHAPGLFVGPVRQPFTLNADRAIVPNVRTLQDLTLHAAPGEASRDYRACLAHAARPPQAGDVNPLLQFVQGKTLAACATSKQVEAAISGRGSGADYPQIHLAEMLRTVAQLIRADLGTRIFYTELGGDDLGPFDTHAGQAANHGALLKQLSESLAAFVADLRRDKLLDRVLLMTFSEFGRTIQENGRRGTDHGSAQPLFLMGGRVRGGLLGKHPPLDDVEGGGQRALMDFRRVYATLLDRWLKLDSRPILGKQYEPLDFLQG